MIKMSKNAPSAKKIIPVITSTIEKTKPVMPFALFLLM